MKSKLVYFFFIVFLFPSCNVNGIYENREEDKIEGEHTTEMFYNYLKNKKFTSTCELFTRKFFTVTDTAKLLQFYQQVDQTCGGIKFYSLLKWKTTIVRGSTPKSEYEYLYEVIRDKCKTKETISMRKENDNVRIINYDVQR